MGERLLELLVYFVAFIISIYGLSALDLSKFLKMHLQSRVQVLFLVLAAALAYLLGSLILILIKSPVV